MPGIGHSALLQISHDTTISVKVVFCIIFRWGRAASSSDARIRPSFLSLLALPPLSSYFTAYSLNILHIFSFTITIPWIHHLDLPIEQNLLLEF
jgi:hypothetical protein